MNKGYRANEPLELLHFDLYGPLTTELEEALIILSLSLMRLLKI